MRSASKRVLTFLTMVLTVLTAVGMQAPQGALAVASSTVRMTPGDPSPGAHTYYVVSFATAKPVPSQMSIQVTFPQSESMPDPNPGSSSASYEQVQSSGVDPRLYVILVRSAGQTFLCQASTVSGVGSQLTVTMGVTADTFAQQQFGGLNGTPPTPAPNCPRPGGAAIAAPASIQLYIGWRDTVNPACTILNSPPECDNFTGMVNPATAGNYPVSVSTSSDIVQGASTLAIKAPLAEPLGKILVAPQVDDPTGNPVPGYGCPVSPAATGCAPTTAEYTLPIRAADFSLSGQRQFCIGRLTLPRGTPTAPGQVPASFTDPNAYSISSSGDPAGTGPRHPVSVTASFNTDSSTGCPSPAVDLTYTQPIAPGDLLIDIAAAAGYQVFPEAAGAGHSPYAGAVNVGTLSNLRVATDFNPTGYTVPFRAFQTHLIPPSVITPTNPIQGAVSGYSMQFQLGPGGNMTGASSSSCGCWSGGSDFFTITFDSPAAFPTATSTGNSISGVTLSDLTQNWSSTSPSSSSDGKKTLTVHIPSANTALGGDVMDLEISEATGIANPSTPGVYSPVFSSNVEKTPIPAAGALQVLGGTGVVANIVQLSNNTAGATSSQKWFFSLNTALVSTATEAITLVYPKGFGGFGDPTAKAPNFNITNGTPSSPYDPTTGSNPNPPGSVTITPLPNGDTQVKLGLVPANYLPLGYAFNQGSPIEVDVGFAQAFVTNPPTASPFSAAKGEFVPNYSLRVFTTRDLAPEVEDGTWIVPGAPAALAFTKPGAAAVSVADDIARFQGVAQITDAGKNPTPSYVDYVHTYPDGQQQAQKGTQVTATTWKSTKTAGAADTAPAGTVSCDPTVVAPGDPPNSSTTDALGLVRCTLLTSTIPGDVYTITATADQGTKPSGTSSPITVVAGAPASFDVTATPAAAQAGSSVVLTALNILDSKGNPVQTGKVTFDVHSPVTNTEVGPQDATITNGVATTSVQTLPNELGTYTFTATATRADGTALTRTGTFQAFRSGYVSLNPARVLDTRSSADPNTSTPNFGTCYRSGTSTSTPCATLGQGGSIDLQITGKQGVPSSASVSAVVLNVTETNPSAPSYLTVYPAGVPRPTASNLNWVQGQTRPNLVEVPVNSAGRITLFNFQGTVDVLADVLGYTGAVSDSSGKFNPQAPARDLDTRAGSTTGQCFQAGATTIPQACSTLPSQGSLNLKVVGAGGVPTSGVSAVILNVTATNPTGSGYLTVFPAGQTQPTASNVNFIAGQTIPNRVIVPVGSNGEVTIYNFTSSPSDTTDVVVDVNGWFTDATTNTGGLFNALTPARVSDTRPASGQPNAGQTLVGGSPLLVTIAGAGGVPTMTAATPPTSVVLNVTATNTSSPSYLSVYPGDQGKPNASDLNWDGPQQTVPNLVVVKLSPDGKINLYNFQGQTDAVVDVVGWYS